MDDRARRIRAILEEAAGKPALRHVVRLHPRAPGRPGPSSGRPIRGLLLVAALATLLAAAGDRGGASGIDPTDFSAPQVSVRHTPWKFAAQGYSDGLAATGETGDRRPWTAGSLPPASGNPGGGPPVL